MRASPFEMMQPPGQHVGKLRAIHLGARHVLGQFDVRGTGLFQLGHLERLAL